MYIKHTIKLYAIFSTSTKIFIIHLETSQNINFNSRCACFEFLTNPF